MWILVCEKTGRKYNIVAKKNYLIGRKEADILIEGDPSISRKHANLLLSHLESNLSNPEKKGIVLLKDCNSKYGTFINGKQVKGESVIHEGEVITFGQLGSNFRLSYEPLVVATSCLDASSKNELQSILLALGGHVISEWRANCTHLVMSQVKITVKAVCAMVSLKPLVLLSYFRDLLDNCSGGNTIFPNEIRYIPPIGEEMLFNENVIFEPVQKRATLFTNKTFVFFSKKQFKKLHLPVSVAGGHAELFEPDEPIDEGKLLHADTCIVRSECETDVTDVSRMYASEVEGKLRKLNKRTIPESDIGLAIVYCCMEKFCNPEAKPDSLQLSQLPSQTLSQEFFVPETQPASPPDFDGLSQTSVPETVFCTQKQDGEKSCDDDSTLEADDNIKKRFRKSSSEDSALPSSPKKARVEKEPISIESSVGFSQSLVKLEKASSEENEMIDWDCEADTQPLTCVTNEIMERFSDKTQSDNGNVECYVSKNVPICSTPFGFQPSKKSVLMIEQNNASEVQDGIDKDLPAKLMTVTFQSLVQKPSSRSNVGEDASTSRGAIKNFKKFRKVHPALGCHLPRIIGGKDLQVFQQRIDAREVDLWLDEEDDFGDMENNFASRGHKRAKKR